MKKPRPIPNLDTDVEEEVGKLVEKTADEPLEEFTSIKDGIEIHTVDLAAVAKFESEAKTKTEEDRQDEEDGGRNIARENGRKRETAISERIIKRKSKLIY